MHCSNTVARSHLSLPANLRKNVGKIQNKLCIAMQVFLKGFERKYCIIKPSSQHKNSNLCPNCPWKIKFCKKYFPAAFLPLLDKIRGRKATKITWLKVIFFIQCCISQRWFELWTVSLLYSIYVARRGVVNITNISAKTQPFEKLFYSIVINRHRWAFSPLNAKTLAV